MNQPTVNIGLLGHVANGKSSLVRAITGEKTSRNDSRCLQKTQNREMTIQIGYSNAKIYKCDYCPEPDCYTSQEGSCLKIPKCSKCGNDSPNCVKFVSFIDCPGHRMLMKNMISGSAVMDCCILVIDANKKAAQTQTIEHLATAEIVGISNYIAISQNKIDLNLNKEIIKNNYDDIKELTNCTGADTQITPVIPMSVSPNNPINVKDLLQQIVHRATSNPNQIYDSFPLFLYCIRSFDINKPGVIKNTTHLNGGVIGVSILKGTVKIGDVLEIRPGYKSSTGTYIPLLTTVVSLYTGKISLQEASTGGLIGIGTTLDPYLTRSDKMVGMCAGYPGSLPPQSTNINLRVIFLNKGLGSEIIVKRLELHQIVELSIGAFTVKAKVMSRKKRMYTFITNIPVCKIVGQTIPISINNNGTWTIIAKGSDTLTQPLKQSVSEPFNALDYHTHLLENALQQQIKTANRNLKIDTPLVYKEGSVKLIWVNFTDICNSINRTPQHVLDYFSEEFMTKIQLNSDAQFILHGKNNYNTNHIRKILKRYIKNFVICDSCKSYSTTLNKLKGTIFQLVCKDCGSEFLR